MIEEGFLAMYFVRVWSDCGLRSEIVLDLLGDDLFVDVPVRYPVLILGRGRHLINVCVDEFYEDI